MSAEDRSFAILAYGLSALLPVVAPWSLYWLSRKDRPFVAAHARKAALESLWIHGLFAVLIGAAIGYETYRLYQEALSGLDVDQAMFIDRVVFSRWTLGTAAIGALFYWARLASGGLVAARGLWPG